MVPGSTVRLPIVTARVGGPALELLADLVELEAEPVGEEAHGAAPRERERAGREQERRRVHRLAEAHRLEQDLRLVVRRVVDDLLDADLLPAPGQAREDERQHVVREARVDARGEERRATRRARVGEAIAHLGKNECGWTSGTTELDTTFLPAARMRTDVLDGFERAEVGGRGVADAVGVRGEQRVDVVRRLHPGRRPAAERAGVATDLRRTVGPQAHELELRVVYDVAQRVRADVPSAPLDHAIGH
jgi:hypothetical protein